MTNLIPIDPFDQFWQAYPRKIAKKKARQVWDRINPDSALTKKIVFDVTVRAQGDPQWTRGFAPHPATYLNQERWDDEWQAPAPSRSTRDTSLADDLLDGSWAE